MGCGSKLPRLPHDRVVTVRQKERENEMNETKTAGLRLPVQAAVDRTATYATLADGGVEASQNASQIISGLLQALPTIFSMF